MHGPLSNKNIRSPQKKKTSGTPPPPPQYAILFEDLQKLSQVSENFAFGLSGLGEMSEGDFEYTCANKFPLVSMGG